MSKRLCDGCEYRKSVVSSEVGVVFEVCGMFGRKLVDFGSVTRRLRGRTRVRRLSNRLGSSKGDENQTETTGEG
jgi:hypothetical protein